MNTLDGSVINITESGKWFPKKKEKWEVPVTKIHVEEVLSDIVICLIMMNVRQYLKCFGKALIGLYKTLS